MGFSGYFLPNVKEIFNYNLFKYWLRVCQKKAGVARRTIVGGYWGLLGVCKEKNRLTIGASSLCSLRTTCMSSRVGNELGLISLTPETSVGHCHHYYWGSCERAKVTTHTLLGAWATHYCQWSCNKGPTYPGVCMVHSSLLLLPPSLYSVGTLFMYQ